MTTAYDINTTVALNHHWSIEHNADTVFLRYRDIDMLAVWIDADGANAELVDLAAQNLLDTRARAEDLLATGRIEIIWGCSDPIDLTTHVQQLDGIVATADALRPRTREAWQAAVAAGDTDLGYTDWKWADLA